jgi:hypothetical protein
MIIHIIKTATIMALLLLISCTGPNGPDGNYGKSYLTVSTTDSTLYYYADNNPRRGVAKGLQIALNQPYSVSPGTYSFQYEARAYTTSTSYYYIDWSGTYAIWSNKGQKGQKGGMFWQSGIAGEDGADTFLTLVCNFYGSTQSRMNKRSNYVHTVLPDSVITVDVISENYNMHVIYNIQKYGFVSGTSIEK